MGMKKCKKCGKEIDKKDKVCPHCGAKVKKKTGLIILLVIVIVIVLLIAIASAGGSSSSSSTSTPKKQTTAVPKEDIAALIEKGNAAYDSDDYEVAVEALQKVFESGTDDGMILYRYAYSKLQTSGYDADLYIDAYLSLSKDDPENEYAIRAYKKLLENSESLDYRKAMLGDYKERDIFQSKGEVFQIFNDDDAFIDTDYDDFWGYSGDKVWLVFDEKPRIMEEDIISVVGLYKGTKKYKTVMGAEEEVPLLEVIGFEILQKD